MYLIAKNLTILRRQEKSIAMCALFRDVHWVIPLLNNPSKPTIYNSLVRLACVGPTRATTATNIPPSLPLSDQVCTFTLQKEMGGNM